MPLNISIRKLIKSYIDSSLTAPEQRIKFKEESRLHIGSERQGEVH